MLSGQCPEAKSFSYFCVNQNTMSIIHTDTVKAGITGGPTETAQLQSSWLEDPGASSHSQVFICLLSHSRTLLRWSMGLMLCWAEDTHCHALWFKYTGRLFGGEQRNVL